LSRLCWVICVCCLGLAASAEASQMKTLYSRALQAYKAQKWAAAAAGFQRLLPLMKKLQAKRAKGTKAYHLMALGRCDVLFHLADIHWRRKRYRASCRLHQRIASLRKGLPAAWRRWGVHPDVPRRLAASSQQLANECANVPAQVVLQVSPAGARVSMRQGRGQWGRVPSDGFPTRKARLTLRFAAAGYITKVRKDIAVLRWRVLRLKVTLKAKPRPRIIARKPPRRRPKRLPLPPTPVYKTWWFWTITGVVVAGGVAVAVGLALRDRELAFEGDANNPPGFAIW